MHGLILILKFFGLFTTEKGNKLLRNWALGRVMNTTQQFVSRYYTQVGCNGDAINYGFLFKRLKKLS